MTVPAAAGEVGFQATAFPDASGETVPVGIWYPTLAAASDQRLNLFTQHVAPNAPIDGKSHALIDFMLATWPDRAAINPARVGMFGFSSGGFTTLALIGGVPDLAKIGPYCVSNPQAYVCNVVREHPDTPRISRTDWITDPRIKTAVVVAPALGFSFAPTGLAAVHIPVQLWRAGDDHILPLPDAVDPVRNALPRPPEYHVVAGADHFDFLAPCSEDLAHYAPMICQEHGAFDRAAFHRAFDAEIVRFFERTLR